MGGQNTSTLGVCKASTESRLDGVHGGINAGRACWTVAGTLCGGKAQGTCAEKIETCLECDFYDHVKKQEGKNFLKLADLWRILCS